ncbi:MAG: lysylphosphatidylglycerol synthase transmembrane domain-containing protein [Syntrophales bacterium]|nr:lysylphosphatidylglycerol synthase transmembrane domain-containing protein [Syntrophales bacterium]
MKKLIAGILLSIVLLYLSVRGIDFSAVMDGFQKIDFRYIYPVILLIVLMQVVRSVRWGILLSPLEKVDQFSLFAVTNVGFMAIVAIPARLGELARPYLITKKSNIKMSSALGTIFIERVFDSLTVFAVFIVVLILTPLPPWLVRSSIFFLALTLAIGAFILLMLFRREACLSILNPLICRLPGRFAPKVNNLLHHFIDGFQIMTDLRRLMVVSLLSAFFWFFDILVIYLMFGAFHMQLSPIAACVLLVILMIGIAIPAGPGFVGNWHYFCILGLSLYGIPKAEALSFAIIYHFLSIGIVVLLGIIFLPFNRFSLTDMKKSMNS